MAKTKAMCIINRTDKLIRIQHEKKHGSMVMVRVRVVKFKKH